MRSPPLPLAAAKSEVPTAAPSSGLLPGWHRFFWPEGRPEGDCSPWLSLFAQKVLWWMLVAFAALDVVQPLPAVTGSWWCAFFILWIVPWPRPVATDGSWVGMASGLSSLILIGWLIYRTQIAVHASLTSWHVFSPMSSWTPLSYPMRATLATLVTAAFVVVPLLRLVGERATTFVIIASLPYALTYLPIRFSYPPVWEAHTIQAEAINLCDAALTLLIVAELSSLLTRFPHNVDLIPGYRHLRSFFLGSLNGKLNAFVAVFILYCGALAWCFLVERMWGDPDRSPTTHAICSVVLPVSFFIVLLSALATWRSLARAGRRHVIFDNLATLGRLFVATTAPLVALIGFFFFMPTTAIDLSEGIRFLAGRPWQVVVDGHLLRVSGEFTPGIGKAVESALDGNPGIRVVVLRSPGGDMNEGYRIANAVQSHHLSTAVSHECASACTDAFVAGRERILIPDTRLGFHACRPTVWYSECNDRQYKTFMADKGIDQGFVQKAMAVPAASMWYPAVKELIAAHVVTRTTKPTFDTDVAGTQADTRVAAKLPE